MIFLKDSDGNELYVQEGESANITATFHFQEETFNKAAIASLLLTLYDAATGEIINGREEQNVKDANGGAVATDGTLTMELDSDDNLIIDDDLAVGQGEQHIARLIWTWNDGNSVRTGIEELAYYVQKLITPVSP